MNETEHDKIRVNWKWPVSDLRQ